MILRNVFAHSSNAQYHLRTPAKSDTSKSREKGLRKCCVRSVLTHSPPVEPISQLHLLNTKRAILRVIGQYNLRMSEWLTFFLSLP